MITRRPIPRSSTLPNTHAATQSHHQQHSSKLRYILLLVVIVSIVFVLSRFHLLSTYLQSQQTSKHHPPKRSSKLAEKTVISNTEFENELLILREKQLKHPGVSLHELHQQRKHALLDYQVHSWNDLDQWTQGLKKGVTWFKFDLWYTPAAFAACNGKPCFVSEYMNNNNNNRFLTTSIVINS
jgi:hypothetical protein